MKGLRFAFLVSVLFSLAPSFATAQSMIRVNEMNNDFNDEFIVKLTVDGNTGGTYRGYSLTSPLQHAEIYWLFQVPTNNGQVMITANAIPGYQFGDPFFVPYDPSGAFCSLIIDPSKRLVVDLLVDATGTSCTIS